MTYTKEMNMKVIKVARNEDYMTVLAKKENGNYAVLTKNHGKSEYNSLYRSFKEIDQAMKWFIGLAE